MKISNIAKKYNLTNDTLRYYEKLGLINPKDRNNGVRIYDEENEKILEFIICMKKTGLSLNKIKEYLDLYEKGQDTFEQRKNILISQSQQIINEINNLKEIKKYLDLKIKNYEKK